MKILALKVDVDTLRGHREGVLNLLNLFDRLSLKASFFFSMGPDNSGKAIVRIFRKGFLGKMLRTKAPSTYGFKTLFYGTLIKAPMIAQSFPGLLKETARRGHDFGIHAWDHVKWQDRIHKLPVTTIEADLRRAFDLFYQYTGHQPRSFAAPGWQVSQDALLVLDSMRLRYTSNTRGLFPYVPRWGRKAFSTLEIPTTLPTMDELLGRRGLKGEEMARHLASLLKEGLNVFTLHAEMEGLSQIGVFESFLRSAMDQGAKCVPLSFVADQIPRDELPRCEIGIGTVEGRAGTLAVQATEA
ncbi:polysaccharide deacetylase [Thermanaerovibrio acidaminovorans DSM 6589]|uniref:Polysaccharide deacetylase n=1 Tax=Thermanaerovibrio acidaminovorans (strain ATCC 49978 / DSM 6589 / Su883) TaxID=525903 RepID=D1B8B1_THEAS|nr:polysaccharide deacetylase family protein [Thermanaerovibrio acidaminovorans]ACZ18514.1 polysaccharide deacetylase [Thermanaerovibrio acidaminovorans DSM 6589]